MKKFLTFSNFLALLGIMTFFFFFIPCFTVKDYEPYMNNSFNLFTAMFGGSLSSSGVVVTLVACGPLIAAFVFVIVALILNISKIKVRVGSLFAAPFYIAAGIIFCCAYQIVYTTNVNVGLSTTVPLYVSPWLYVIGAFFISIGGLCIVDSLATFIKPKEKEVY